MKIKDDKRENNNREIMAGNEKYLCAKDHFLALHVRPCYSLPMLHRHFESKCLTLYLAVHC